MRGRILLLCVLLAGCQGNSHKPKDLSGGMTDGPMKVQFSKQHKETVGAIASMRTKCREKWEGDSGMIAYCEEQQMPKLRRFTNEKVMYESMNKNGLFQEDVQRYQKCKIAYWGDFEMATACVENDKAVAVLSRY